MGFFAEIATNQQGFLQLRQVLSSGIGYGVNIAAGGIPAQRIDLPQPDVGDHCVGDQQRRTPAPDAMMLPVTVLLVVLFVKEAPAQSVQRTEWKKGLRILKNNGPFKRMMLMLLIVITGESFRNALSVFFMQHVIQIQAHIGMMYLLYFGVGILGIPFWLVMGKRIGKHKAFCVAVGVSSASILGMFFLQAGQLVPFAIMFALKGFCFAAFQFLPLSMLADIVDLDTARSKEHRTGLFFAMSGMAQKLAMAIGLGLSLGLLALVGFDAQASVHSADQLLALRVLYILGPVSLYMAAFAIAWRYPLTSERQERIHQWVVRRNARVEMAARTI